MEDMHNHTVGTEVKDPKKPGPRNDYVRCFIRRDRKTSSFTLLQEPPFKVKEKKFLLAARKIRNLKSSEYIISTNPNTSRDSDIDVIGKFKSNFSNTNFTIYESESSHMEAVPTLKPTSRRHISSSKLSPGGNAGGYSKVAVISFKNFRDYPSPMECSLLTIPASVMSDPKGSAPTPTEHSMTICNEDDSTPSGLGGTLESSGARSRGDRPLVLNSRPWVWRNTENAWCMGFLRAHDFLPNSSITDVLLTEHHPMSRSLPRPRLLQFGKTGKDEYIVDYCYPLSAFQAFAIFLSRVEFKHLAQLINRVK